MPKLMTTLTFTRLLIGELPFMLNLPTGAYSLPLEGDTVTLNLLQEHCAVSDGGQAYRLLPTAQVPADRIASATALRTLVQLRESFLVDPMEIQPPPDDELVGALAREQISRGAGLTGQELLDSARVDLTKLDAEARGFLVATVARKLHARRLFPPEKHELFISAVNTLVRHYMVEFEDPFAEEVVLHHLASMWTGGVLQVLQCDGALLDSTHYAGKIPPVMRRPWIIHPPERVERFRTALADGLPVDPIALLAARAFAFLERGATRSAVIEASAALETAVARRIGGGLLALGSSEQDASTRLSTTQRFSDRCKTLMREVTGQSLAHVDPPLWERVVKHRENYRNKVSHDDSEPPMAGAREAVQDLVALARIAQRL
jgi:hypothetical protein